MGSIPIPRSNRSRATVPHDNWTRFALCWLLGACRQNCRARFLATCRNAGEASSLLVSTTWSVANERPRMAALTLSHAKLEGRSAALKPHTELFDHLEQTIPLHAELVTYDGNFNFCSLAGDGPGL